MLKDTVQKLDRNTIETETKQALLSWKLGHIMCSVLNDKKSQNNFGTKGFKNCLKFTNYQ